MRKFFGEFYALDFADEDFGLLRHGNAREGCDGVRALTHDLGVQRAVDENGFAYLFRFVGLEQIASALGKLFSDFVIDGIDDDDRLLAGADHAVVKRFAQDNRAHRREDVRRVVDDGGHVSAADADGGFAAAICALDHAGAAGCEDAVRFLHRKVGQLQTRRVHPVDNAFRRACGNRRFEHDARRLNGGTLCARMRANEDAVAGFQRDQGLKDRGRGRVRGRDDRCDDADGFRDARDAIGLVLFDHAAGLCVAVCVVDVFGSKVVFDDLVFHNAHARLFHGELRQRNARLVCGGCGGKKNLVHLLLCVGCKCTLRFAQAGKRALHGFYAINRGSACLVFHTLHLLLYSSRVLRCLGVQEGSYRLICGLPAAEADTNLLHIGCGVDLARSNHHAARESSIAAP